MGNHPMADKVSSSCALQMYCALFLVLSRLISCSCVNAHDIYSEATCQTRKECLTLLDVLNDRNRYFASDLTLVFHDGVHILHGEVVSVSNISNFTLQGYSNSSSGLSSPTITCVNSTLSFSDVSMAITSIDFNHCSISLSRSAAVVQDSRFENGSVVNGGAMTVLYSTVQFDGTNSFACNMAGRHGGAIYAEQSTLTFSGTTAFTENMAHKGGAVYCGNNTSLSFSGNSIFMKNTAEWLGNVSGAQSLGYGGAVAAWFNNTLNFNGSSSFINNTADYGGAVLAWDNNTLNFNGSSTFMSNTADDGGGAVLAWDSNTLNFNGSSSFMSNTADYGGAVYAEDSNTLNFNGSSSFMNNTALVFGGAVFAWDSNTLNFNGRSSFINNTAVHGGGGVYDASITVYYNETSSRSLFMSNKTDNDGGAVFALVSNTLSFNGSSSFLSNTAKRFGGAVTAWYNNIMTFSGNSSFMNNTAKWFGGAVHTWDSSSLIFNGNSSFTNNTAEFVGGAVGAWDSNTLTFNGNSSFINNTAGWGGAVYVEFSNTLTFNGSNSFMNSKAGWHGGAVHANFYNTLNFNGSSIFMSNTAGIGGAVSAENSNTLSFNGSSSFMTNTAGIGGAVGAFIGNTLSFNGSSSFMSNTAGDDGGAVYAVDGNSLSFNGNSSFMSNMAGGDGGAVYVEDSSVSFHGSSTFANNEAGRGGGIALFINSQMHLSGTASLLLNTANIGGGAFIQDSSIDSTENITVIGNEAVNGGGLFVQSSDITLQGTGLLAGNRATNPGGGYGGAMIALSSIVELQGSFDVTNNTAEFGGGLALFGVYDGVLIIKNGTNLIFVENLAYRRGGAIYVEENRFSFCAFDNATQDHIDEACFFQTREGPYNCFDPHDSDYLATSNTQTSLKFEGNTAILSGDIMYGGHLESCVVCTTGGFVYGYTLGAETFRNFTEYKIDVFSKLSSDPYKVCICEDGDPDCDLREVNHTFYPGQVLVTSVVAVGQMNGIVPSVIRAVSDDLIGTPDFQETQPKECSQLQYPLFSDMSNTSLKLYSDESCSTSGYPLTLLISFHPCPVGFTLSEQHACICDERLQKYTQNCNIENVTISRDAGDNFWVGVEGTDKLILHPHCPFDYCIEEPANFPLNSTDMQCANGRSGILCGACQPGRSLTLGSSRCLSDCSNGFIALLLVFAFAGVALVTFLFLCHLTVAEGTLSGLIFYANVLSVNQTVFFPLAAGERNLLTVFIAWLNLDLGIKTCFFVDLDAYYRTWLQFGFPIYIWVMVGVIIVLADRSTGFAKIIGSTNPVAVLATLFLLSYTKLLRAIMAAFSFTTLDYPDGDSKYVWLYDGNIGYLDRHDGRHMALFLFSLLFLLFVFIPYTLLLLCGQWIQRQLWWLSSTKQLYLKIFLDAHYGPYKNRHRYWTGLLLLLRFFMLFVATIININNPQDPYSNLLVILVVASSLMAWSWFFRRIYKKWYHNTLEGLFILNLVVLAGGTYQVRLSGGNQAALVYTSVSIAFVTFMGIVLSAVIKRVKEKVAEHRRRAVNYPTNDSQDDEEDSVQLVPSVAPTSDVTYSVLEIVRQHPDQTTGEIELRPLTSESHKSTS